MHYVCHYPFIIKKNLVHHSLKGRYYRNIIIKRAIINKQGHYEKGQKRVIINSQGVMRIFSCYQYKYTSGERNIKKLKVPKNLGILFDPVDPKRKTTALSLKLVIFNSFSLKINKLYWSAWKVEFEKKLLLLSHVIEFIISLVQANQYLAF